MRCGLFWALVVITRLPDRDPFALGLKVTLIEQVAFGAMEAGQVLVWEKSAGFAPLIAMPLTDSVVPPALVRVTDFVAVPEFAFTVPKLRLGGLNEATGSMTVAVSGTVCGLPAALSLIISVAVCGL